MRGCAVQQAGDGHSHAAPLGLAPPAWLTHPALLRTCATHCAIASRS